MPESEDPLDDDTPDREGPGMAGLASFLKLQGMLIAQLALDRETSAELTRAAVHAAERVPAWMELRVYGGRGEVPRLFTLGCLQLLEEQRAALERIVDDQVDDPEPIQRVLDNAPFPPTDEDRSTEELLTSCSAGLAANFQATLAIARDFDRWIEEELSAGEERARAAGIVINDGEWIGEDILEELQEDSEGFFGDEEDEDGEEEEDFED